jgi:hypothetical protein
MTKELMLESRYIHTGNSGVWLKVSRDLREPKKAVLDVENSAMGLFETKMHVVGTESGGMTADQLRDIALMFLESAHKLDQIEAGAKVWYEYENKTNYIYAENRIFKSEDVSHDFLRWVGEKCDTQHYRIIFSNELQDRNNAKMLVHNDGNTYTDLRYWIKARIKHLIEMAQK